MDDLLALSGRVRGEDHEDDGDGDGDDDGGGEDVAGIVEADANSEMMVALKARYGHLITNSFGSGGVTDVTAFKITTELDKVGKLAANGDQAGVGASVVSAFKLITSKECPEGSTYCAIFKDGDAQAHANKGGMTAPAMPTWSGLGAELFSVFKVAASNMSITSLRTFPVDPTLVVFRLPQEFFKIRKEVMVTAEVSPPSVVVLRPATVGQSQKRRRITGNVKVAYVPVNQIISDDTQGMSSNLPRLNISTAHMVPEVILQKYCDVTKLKYMDETSLPFEQAFGMGTHLSVRSVVVTTGALRASKEDTSDVIARLCRCKTDVVVVNKATDIQNQLQSQLLNADHHAALKALVDNALRTTMGGINESLYTAKSINEPMLREQYVRKALIEGNPINLAMLSMPVAEFKTFPGDGVVSFTCLDSANRASTVPLASVIARLGTDLTMVTSAQNVVQLNCAVVSVDPASGPEKTLGEPVTATIFLNLSRFYSELGIGGKNAKTSISYDRLVAAVRKYGVSFDPNPDLKGIKLILARDCVSYKASKISPIDYMDSLFTIPPGNVDAMNSEIEGEYRRIIDKGFNHPLLEFAERVAGHCTMYDIKPLKACADTYLNRTPFDLTIEEQVDFVKWLDFHASVEVPKNLCDMFFIRGNVLGKFTAHRNEIFLAWMFASGVSFFGKKVSIYEVARNFVVEHDNVEEDFTSIWEAMCFMACALRELDRVVIGNFKGESDICINGYTCNGGKISDAELLSWLQKDVQTNCLGMLKYRDLHADFVTKFGKVDYIVDLLAVGLRFAGNLTHVGTDLVKTYDAIVNEVMPAGVVAQVTKDGAIDYFVNMWRDHVDKRIITADTEEADNSDDDDSFGDQ